MMEKFGVERFSVMGTSYDGCVAYHLAKMWPERVEKVLNKLLNLAMARQLDIIPDFFLSDIIQISLNGKLFQLVTVVGAGAAGFDIQGIREKLPWIQN
ncbi:hypothetical protein ACFX2F_018070 [Malus domestica]